ncbi:MAG TPA: hypothetical protein VJ951_04050 [Bacteroidales bacterium]|nr:hypothetical protein [Bacteroidales bacterium]
MKVVGFVVLAAGLFYTIYSFLYVPEITTPTSGLEVYVGLLVIATGAFTIYQTSKSKELET